MSEPITEAMLQAAYRATGCPVSEHGPGPRNREFFTQIYRAMRAASGMEARRAATVKQGAVHESPVRRMRPTLTAHQGEIIMKTELPMVEKVARAIYASSGLTVGDERDDWDELNECSRCTFRTHAQAAIDAILPTDDAGLVELLADLEFLFANQDGTYGDREVIYGEVSQKAYAAILSLTADKKALEEALRSIADGEAFRMQRFAEDNDADYFLRAQRHVQLFARAALSTISHKRAADEYRALKGGDDCDTEAFETALNSQRGEGDGA
jgi:hypothetical protein